MLLLNKSEMSKVHFWPLICLSIQMLFLVVPLYFNYMNCEDIFVAVYE